jgi:CRP/FNR family cyclic AMP-dependent transcriptional regulator
VEVTERMYGERRAPPETQCWPRPTRDPPPVSGSEPSASTISLIDVDDELARGFDSRARSAARRAATARLVASNRGRFDPGDWTDFIGTGPGLLVLDGIVAVETRVEDRTATELVGAGDLLQPTGNGSEKLIEPAEEWATLDYTQFALLDDAFAERVRPWPQIGRTLLRRVSRRIANVELLRAIASQPRLEVRLVLLLWHLAARWGHVSTQGVRVNVPLTHRLLGELVSAERPSVSHALARLSRAGLIVGRSGDWRLLGTLEGHLEALKERPAAREAS